MDIMHTKKQLVDKITSQTCDSMKRNLSHQTKHARKSNKNWEIQNACDIMLTCLELPISVSFPVQSIIFEWLRVGHSFIFWAEKLESNSFEAKLLTPSLPKEKRGTTELFPIICQSAPYLVDKVTLGWFTPNPV